MFLEGFLRILVMLLNNMIIFCLSLKNVFIGYGLMKSLRRDGRSLLIDLNLKEMMSGFSYFMKIEGCGF